MNESSHTFKILLDDKEYTVSRIIQPDESVVFTLEIEGKQLKLYKTAEDEWAGNGDEELIARIGRAIEKG